MSHLKKLGLMMVFFGFHHAWLHAANFSLDPPHTSIGFSVKHLMITDVSGQSKTYEAKVELDEKTNELKGLEANIRVSSIDTDNAKRDGHLKSPDFFDAEQFPNILFKSRTINKLGTDEYEVIGDLTIKGITKTITLRGKNTGFIDAGMMG